MLEDSKMEKKSMSRSSQPQPRASTVDCKKPSDVRSLPRNNKKREPPASNSKNDLHRKNYLSVSRSNGQNDRRQQPRSRDGYVMGGATSTRLAEDKAELGSVFGNGSKKQSLDHLINFQYNHPRKAVENNWYPPRRYPQTTMKKHNQDLFLQANCQFVVKESGDYSQNLLDPDKLIEWEQIEEIMVRSNGSEECPICLGPPVAGRVGRCGHVHCWPCALHYAQTHHLQPPPCPVCAAPFKVTLMKPARIVFWGPSDKKVTMRLVRRLRGSTVVEIAPPRNKKKVAENLPSVDLINEAPFTKLFGATEKQVKDILERERRELQDQILAEIDTSEIVYIEQALQQLKDQEQKIDNLMSVTLPSTSFKDTPPPVVCEQQTCSNSNRIDWFDMIGDENGTITEEAQISDSLCEDVEQCSLNDSNKTEHLNDKDDLLGNNVETDTSLAEGDVGDDKVTGLTDLDKENMSKYFYFYQGEDGQQIFLHNMNVRMLCATWQALVAAPRVISATVLGRSTESVSHQDFRKRMPCTAHLPLHCPFDIVELKLEAPEHVSKEVLQTFAEDISKRAHKRSQQRKREKRREQELQLKQRGPPRPDFASQLHFPPAPSAPIAPILPTSSTAPPSPTAPTSPAPPEPSTSAAASPSGVSFAKVASTSGAWRVRVPPPAPSPPSRDPLEPVDAAFAPRPHFLCDDIEAAIHAPPSGSSSGRNKKKKNKKVLFITGVQAQL